MIKLPDLKKAKEIAAIIGVIATASAAIWGAFKPEKKAEASYAVTAAHISTLEAEVNNLYDLASIQQDQIAYLVKILSAPVAVTDNRPEPQKSSAKAGLSVSALRLVDGSATPAAPANSITAPRPRPKRPELPAFGAL